MTIAATIEIPRYTAGIWDIDPGHSEVSFTVPHMMVSKVRGRFGKFSGQIVTGEELTGSSVTATVEAASVDTGNERRDRDLRSAGFLDVETHPFWTFRSTCVRIDGDGGGVVVGERVQINLEIEAVLRQA